MSLVRTAAGWLLPLIILGAAIAGFLVLGGPKPPARREAEPPRPVAVRTAAVDPETAGIEIELDGTVVPLREATLAAEVSGRVLAKSARCDEGQVVSKGDILFEIDPRDYEFEVARLEKELTQSGLAIEEVDEELTQNAASIDLARRQLELSQREVARLQGLKAGKIVTESEHDRAVRDELTATNALTTLEGQKRVFTKRRSRLVEAQALAATLLEKAKLDLSRTRITSPVDGIVVEDKVEQDSFVTKGTPLVTIEDTSATEVKTSLRMSEVAQVWGGGRADQDAHGLSEIPAKVVFTLGDRRYEWDGVLSRQEGRGLDAKTRTLPCRVRVPDPTRVRALDRYGAPLPSLPAGAPRALLRGMFVEIVLHVETPQELVSVPQEAVRPSGDVMLVRDGRLVVLQPKAFHTTGPRVLFDAAESGIQPGERVVVSQIANPREGMELAESAP